RRHLGRHDTVLSTQSRFLTDDQLRRRYSIFGIEMVDQGRDGGPALEHVLFEHARILKKRAIEPTTWIARANPISRKLL
ncbi:MAG: hypothetical protein VCD66_05220, partial [Alphaproteobacteria bacterium]